MMKERYHDALHDGRSVGAAGGRGVRLGARARRGVRDVPCRARGAVSARRAAQGAGHRTALPTRRPARDRWPVVREAVIAERRRRRERWGVWSVAAAAAVAGLLVFHPFGTSEADAA